VNLRSEEVCTAAVRQHQDAMMYVPMRLRDALATKAEAGAEPEAGAEELDVPRP
jgi:hypothetical protein